MCYDSKRAFKGDALPVLSDNYLSSFYKKACSNTNKWSLKNIYSKKQIYREREILNTQNALIFLCVKDSLGQNGLSPICQLA